MNVCPIGWGFPKDYPIEGVTAKSLPELPMLDRICDPIQRNRVVVDAIRNVPGLAVVLRPADIARKYGLPRVTANVILQRARQS